MMVGTVVDELVDQVRSTMGPLSVRGRRGLPLPFDAENADTVELGRMSGIVELSPADERVTVGAGTPIADLDSALAEAGVQCVLDPWWPNPTVGGVIAAGLNGPRRLGYGPVRDQVLGLRMVIGTGDVVTVGGKVVKNVTGYDVCRLVTGSMGRYGVIVEVTLRTRPRADASRWFASGVVGPAVSHLRTRDSDLVLVEGRADEIDAWAGRVGAEAIDPSDALQVIARPSVRGALAPQQAEAAVSRLPGELSWVLEPLYGIIHIAGPADTAATAIEQAGGRALRYGGARADFLRATAPTDPVVDDAVAAAFDPSRRFDWRLR